MNNPVTFIEKVNSLYGDAFPLADMFRAGKGVDLPDWPPYVFLPYAAWYAVTCGALKQETLTNYADLAVMHLISIAGTWRLTQDIVRFDADLYTELASTPISGDIPAEILYRIPAWCIYIETPLMEVMGVDVSGFWALLEHDANTGHDELRLYFWGEQGEYRIYPVILHIGDWDLTECLNRTQATAMAFTKSEEELRNLNKSISGLKGDEGLKRCLNLLLYICAYGFPYQKQETTGVSYPQPKKTKKGWRFFPAPKPTIRNIGEEIGESLREARKREGSAHKTHSGKRPHIRRAHWHGFWHGSKKDATKRLFSLKWLPPIAVNVGED